MSTVSFVQRVITRFSGGYVLAFHEILPDKAAELIESLRPSQPVSLAEMVQRSKSGRRTSGLFAITVDDGVGYNVRALSTLFQTRQWPATFYLSTQYIDSGRRMLFQWWRQIVPLLPRRRIELTSCVVDLSTQEAVDSLSREMEQLWHSRRIEHYLPMILELIDLVIHEHGIQRESIRPPEAISWEEVKNLSRNELLSFESHAVSHTALSALNEQEIIFELRHSQERISEHTGRECRHFAYPFGNPRSIGLLAPAIAKRYYDSATTMSLGHVDGADPWLLPRIPLYPTNSIFYAYLKIGLKCSFIRPPKPQVRAAGSSAQRNFNRRSFSEAWSNKWKLLL